MRVLTLCGSLRARSTNRALLRAFEQLAPPGLEVAHDRSVAALPAFNPDLDVEPLPPAVAALRREVARADALVVSTPEYVHALPGAFKNLLDWLVSDPTFAGKPVAILHAARNSDFALAALREVLTTMSACIVESAVVLLPLGSGAAEAEAILGRAELRSLLQAAQEALRREVAARDGAAPPA